jgi:hypothetical protein
MTDDPADEKAKSAFIYIISSRSRGFMQIISGSKNTCQLAVCIATNYEPLATSQRKLSIC